jgi:acetylornithine deacetylase/succinyl-diaminopimelate desuccinylase-like protein
MRVEPGAVSAVPGRVTLELETRGIDVDAIARVEAELEAAIDDVALRRDVRVYRRLLRDGAPVALDAALVEAAHTAAARLAIEALTTHSGAGHDAQHLASRVPTALLFVPLVGGESHTPGEKADIKDILAAAGVLIELLSDAGRHRVA